MSVHLTNVSANIEELDRAIISATVARVKGNLTRNELRAVMRACRKKQQELRKFAKMEMKRMQRKCVG